MIRKFFLALLVVILASGQAVAAVPDNFRDLVKNAGPAVVNINTERVVQNAPGPFPFPSPFDEFFRNSPYGDLFDRFHNQQRGRQAPRSKQRSLGSGFLISSDGYIVTNYHVINGAETINVTRGGDRDKEQTFKAELIGGDKDTDLALLKIKASGLPFLKFGDSDAVQVGDWLLAIGNPFGLDHTVTAGILSAKGRNIRSGPFDSFLQTDASINPGNSGGPLLNMSGEVIGINAAIIANGQGIGFAIPSNMAKTIIEDLRKDRKVSRGWIGVTIQNLDEASAKALGLEKAGGALVGDVLPDNPAAKAGVLPGDVITLVNGTAVTSSDDLLRTIAAIKPGEKATLTVWRNGATKNLSITLAERSAAESAAGKKTEKESASAETLGMALQPVTADEAPRLGLDKARGLLVTSVAPESPADNAGIRRGDVVLAVSGTEVSSVKQFGDILDNLGQKRGAVMLYLSRQGQKFFRTLEVTKK